MFQQQNKTLSDSHYPDDYPPENTETAKPRVCDSLNSDEEHIKIKINKYKDATELTKPSHHSSPAPRPRM